MISNFIEEVADWNINRDNLQYNEVLEIKMLDEEIMEYEDACRIDNEVDQADALADIAVVAIGGLTKLCKGNKRKVHDILLAVTAANNAKSSTKNSEGKITKPKEFVGPEAMIGTILNEG